MASEVREGVTRVYWAPGCTSCLRTKEFLRQQGVEFESVNVAANAAARSEMERLGARSVPIVVRGDRFVYAQSLADVRRFLDLPEAADRMLDPATLVARINIILPAALRFVRQMPEAVLDGPFRNSWAPPRGLAHHVFRIVESFLDAIETPEILSYESTMKGTHEVVPGQDVAAFGEAVLGRFNAWWQRYPDRDCSAQMQTYWGTQTVQQVLERTTWHSAQHTRQLMVVLESIGAVIDSPLTQHDLAGLPLPAKAWDDDR